MQRRKKKSLRSLRITGTAQLKDGRFSLYRSKAKFVDQSSIKFTDGKTIKGDRFVLATGSQIAMPPVPGLDQVSFKTSDEVLELTEVPNEVVVLGGGIVACELAQFLQRVGSKVTLLQRSEGILRDFPQRASDCIRNKFTEEGMIVKTGVSIEGWRKLMIKPFESFTGIRELKNPLIPNFSFMHSDASLQRTV